MNFLINFKILIKTASLFSALFLFFNLASAESKVSRPIRPQIKSDEYALFLDDKYIIFKTQKTDDLELDLSCYKKNKKQPDCMALTYAKMKAENVESPNPAMNNMAAFHCAKMNGRNLLALDSKRNEKDFCRFPDKSMVSSWSMYLKHHPTPVLK